MLKIHSFTFNPFQENTYLIIDENNKTIIIDPGMYSPDEFDVFFNFIDQHKLIPELLLNTHTHLDHVFGNAAVLKKFDIPYGFHLADNQYLMLHLQQGPCMACLLKNHQSQHFI